MNTFRMPASFVREAMTNLLCFVSIQLTLITVLIYDHVSPIFILTATLTFGCWVVVYACARRNMRIGP